MFARHFCYFGTTIKTVQLVMVLDFQHDRELVDFPLDVVTLGCNLIDIVMSNSSTEGLDITVLVQGLRHRLSLPNGNSTTSYFIA